MSELTILQIRQEAAGKKHKIRLVLKRSGQPDIEGEAKIAFAVTPQEQEELRWYIEDYLMRPESVQEVQVEQIEQWMKRRGEELYAKLLAANMGTQAVWFAVREQLADLRVHVYAGQGKSSTVVEFARWYAPTGGLGPKPVVLLTSFESHTDLTDVLNQIGQAFAPALQASGIEWHAVNDNEARRRPFPAQRSGQDRHRSRLRRLRRGGSRERVSGMRRWV